MFLPGPNGRKLGQTGSNEGISCSNVFCSFFFRIKELATWFPLVCLMEQEPLLDLSSFSCWGPHLDSSDCL